VNNSFLEAHSGYDSTGVVVATTGVALLRDLAVVLRQILEDDICTGADTAMMTASRHP